MRKRFPEEEEGLGSDGQPARPRPGAGVARQGMRLIFAPPNFRVKCPSLSRPVLHALSAPYHTYLAYYFRFRRAAQTRSISIRIVRPKTHYRSVAAAAAVSAQPPIPNCQFARDLDKQTYIAYTRSLIFLVSNKSYVGKSKNNQQY